MSGSHLTAPRLIPSLMAVSNPTKLILPRSNAEEKGTKNIEEEKEGYMGKKRNRLRDNLKSKIITTSARLYHVKNIKKTIYITVQSNCFW